MIKAKPRRKPIPPFETALEALLERYGFVDFAYVVRSARGLKAGNWIAGDNQDPVADRDRALLIYGDMAVLGETLIAYLKKQPA